VGEVRAGGAYIEVGTRLKKFYAGLNAAQARLNTFAKSAQTIGKDFLKIGTLMAAPLALGVKVFASFEDQMGHVNTMLDEADKKHLAAFRAGVRDMSVEFGESTESITKALYDILSAGVPAADAMGVLRASMIAAAAGATDTQTAADAVTTMLNAYGLEASKAGDVTDWLFAVVKRGKTTFGELAPSIGLVATNASLCGLTMEEMGAALATMTRGGIKSQRAVITLNALLTSFIKPTEEAKEAAREFGFELNTATIRTMGLKGVIDKLVAGGATQEQLAAIFPNVRSFRAVGPLFKQQAGFISDIAFATNRAGLAQQAFTDRTNQQMHAWKQLRRAGEELFRTIGEALAGPVTDFVKWFRSALTTVRDWVQANPGLVKTFGKLAIATMAVGAVLNAIALGAKAARMAMYGLKMAALILKRAIGPLGLVAALMALAIWFTKVRTAMPELQQGFEKQIAATAKLHDENARLLTRLDELLKKQSRSNEEQREANDIAATLTKRLGDVGIAYDEAGNAAGLAVDSFRRANVSMAKQMLPLLESQLKVMDENHRRLTKRLEEMAGWARGYYIQQMLLGGMPEEQVRQRIADIEAKSAELMVKYRSYMKILETGGEKGPARPAETTKPAEPVVPRISMPEVPRAKPGLFDFTTTVMGTFAGAAAAQMRPTTQILGYQLEELRQIREATQETARKIDGGGLT